MFRLIPPFIIPTITSADFKRNKFTLLHIIETRNINRNEFPTDLRDIPTMVSVSTTRFAEQLMNGRGSEYIVRRNVRFLWWLAALRAVRGKQLEFVGTTFSAPKTEFAANCAIAFRGAFGEVEVGGKFDGSTNTTSVICLRGHFFDGMGMGMGTSKSRRFFLFVELGWNPKLGIT